MNDSPLSGWSSDDERPLLAHLPGEFLLWLWYTSERHGAVSLEAETGGDVEGVDIWVDDRIAFRAADSDKPRAVLTGENPASSPEARAALGGGKVLRELRLGFRVEDREYTATLRGPHLDITGAKLPQMIKGAAEEVLYDRMALYEELYTLVAALLRVFARARTSDDWAERILPDIRDWVAGAGRTG